MICIQNLKKTQKFSFYFIWLKFAKAGKRSTRKFKWDQGDSVFESFSIVLKHLRSFSNFHELSKVSQIPEPK